MFVDKIQIQVSKCEVKVLMMVKHTHRFRIKGLLFICSAVLNRKPIKGPLEKSCR